MKHLAPEPPAQSGSAPPTWPTVVRVLRGLERGDSGDSATVWGLLALDGEARAAMGAAKYGVHHQHDNGRDHAVDAYQEALDGLCYAYAEAMRAGWSDATREIVGMALDLAHAWRAYIFARDGQ